MPQWEYYYFEADKIFGDTKFKDGKIKTTQYIDDLGRSGWELVTVIKRFPESAVMGQEGYVFFFKRLLQK